MIETVKDKWRELEARKRAEIEASLKEEQIADPISLLISVGISVAISAASYAISSVFAPKPPRG